MEGKAPNSKDQRSQRSEWGQGLTAGGARSRADGVGDQWVQEFREIWSKRSHGVRGYEKAVSYETKGLLSGRDQV